MKLHKEFIAKYGEEFDDSQELFETLVAEYPEAGNQEIVDFVMEAVLENNDEFPHIDDMVTDFAFSWGRKV
jgi:hypothetical protein